MKNYKGDFVTRRGVLEYAGVVTLAALGMPALPGKASPASGQKDDKKCQALMADGKLTRFDIDRWRMAVLIQPKATTSISLDTLADVIGAIQIGEPRKIEFRFGIRHPEDIFDAPGDADADMRAPLAMIEVNAQGCDAISNLLDWAEVASEHLNLLADLNRSTIVIGPLTVIEERLGDVVAVLAARCEPGITPERFSDWLKNHSQMVRQVLGGVINFGYEQVIVDTGLSRLACEKARFAWRRLDFYESLIATSPSILTDMFSNENLQKAAANDLSGIIDKKTVRAAYMQTRTRSVPVLSRDHDSVTAGSNRVGS